jgi:hypothetical protein
LTRAEQRAEEIAEAEHQEKLAAIEARRAEAVASPGRAAQEHEEKIKALRQKTLSEKIRLRNEVRGNAARQMSECLAIVLPEQATQSRVLAEILNKSIGAVDDEDRVRQRITAANRSAVRSMICGAIWGGESPGLSQEEAGGLLAKARDRDGTRKAQQDRIVEQLLGILVTAMDEVVAIDLQ